MLIIDVLQLGDTDPVDSMLCCLLHHTDNISCRDICRHTNLHENL